METHRVPQETLVTNQRQGEKMGLPKTTKAMSEGLVFNKPLLKGIAFNTKGGTQTNHALPAIANRPTQTKQNKVDKGALFNNRYDHYYGPLITFLRGREQFEL